MIVEIIMAFDIFLIVEFLKKTPLQRDIKDITELPIKKIHMKKN